MNVAVPTFRFLEHVGEVELELEARDEAGIFAAALDAFSTLVHSDAGGMPSTHEVRLTAADAPLLLVAWLEELIYLVDVERLVPERTEALDVSGGRLRAAVIGHRDDPRQLVKAVTLNNLELSPVSGGWRGRVVLDV